MNLWLFVSLLMLQTQAPPANGVVAERFWNIRASDLAVILATLTTSGVMIWAVVQAPKWAVKIQWDLQIRKEQRDRRLALFKTLMATRATPVNPEHVQALNMIDVEFSASLAEDAAVRNAWKNYLDALNDSTNFKAPGHIEKRRDLLAELLQRMGRALNYDFDFTYLKARVYYPQGHEDDAVDNLKIRKAWLEIVEGNKPLKMEVAQSETASSRATELSKAWLDVAQGNKALRMEITGAPLVLPPSTSEGGGT